MRGVVLLFLLCVAAHADWDAEWGDDWDVYSDWNVSSTIGLNVSREDNASLSVDLQDDEIGDLGHRLIDLITGMVAGTNTTTSETWTFVSFVTLVPLPCSAVREVVSLFDRAMRTTNPDAGIESIARRLGGVSCGSDGVCPCFDSKLRKYVTRVMELSSRSHRKHVAYPLAGEFPHHVSIQPLPIF